MRLLQSVPALFLLLNISWVNSQTKDFPKYDALAWNAMLEFRDKDFKNSLQHFTEAFKIIDDDSADDYFYAAAAALNINDSVEAKKLLVKSIEKTNATKEYFLSFIEFSAYRKLPMFADILSDYPDHKFNFYKGLEHPEIYKEIEGMCRLDQEARDSGGRYEDVDSKNIDRLIEITKQYGWQERAWLLLWHQRAKYSQDNYVWCFFKPLIDAEIANKKVRPDFWARFEDEISIDKTGRQIYGLFMTDYRQHPVIDIENVDKRRSQVGLPPLWYMEQVYGFIPQKDYKATGKKAMPLILDGTGFKD